MQQLQRIINNFIWKGNAQKKVVVSKEAAELPCNKGGLAVPNLSNFWDSLKLAWVTRLLTTDENATWKRLAMSKISSALRTTNLTSTRLLSVSPQVIATASAQISNQFWQSLLKLLPRLETTFYRVNPNLVGERVIWDNGDFIQSKGKSFSRKTSPPSFVKKFNTISDFLSEKNDTNTLMTEEEAKEIVGLENIGLWNSLVEQITSFLTAKNLTWYSVSHPETGPNHLGWSRIAMESINAKKYYRLLSTNLSRGRNPNERFWSSSGLTTYSEARWDNIYRNQGKLRCNRRIWYEEWRVMWGRQELNKYKDKYAPLKGGNATSCSYCQGDVENELHLYTDCRITDEFWHKARDWYMLTFGIAPPLVLKGPRLFGLEKEQPNDLYNIFYRSVRYSIFYNRKKTILPSLKYFTTLVRDELKIKYGANRHLKYAASPTEARALLWMRKEMGWAQTIPERMPTITNN